MVQLSSRRGDGGGNTDSASAGPFDAGDGDGGRRLPDRPAPRPRLVVAAVRQPATSLFFVAQAVGCFRSEGIDLDERTFEIGRDALALLRDGTADAAIAFETPVLRAAYTDRACER